MTTSRLTSNTPIPVVDARMMEEGISDRLKLLCHIRKTPIVLYGMFVELLRQFYSDPDNSPIDVCATWDPNKTLTKVWIDTEYKWEDEVVEFRPAIYVKLGDIQYQSLTGKADGYMYMDVEEGERHYSRDGVGIVQLMHVGTQKGEAVALAGATHEFFDAFAGVIRDDFCFRTLEVSSVSPLQLDKESKERYRSVVNVRIGFEDTWVIKLESPKLKRIVINAGQGLIESAIV